MSSVISGRSARRGSGARGLVLACAAGLVLAPVGRAADTAWTGATGSAWGTAGNWSNGVPTSADNAQLLSGKPNTTITLTGSNDANQLQVWDGASYTLTAAAPATLTLADQLYLFSNPTSSGLNIGGALAVAAPNGSIGTGTGDVGGALTVGGGTSSVSIANTFNVGYDGVNNILDVQSGGTFTAKDLILGTVATASNNAITVTSGALNATNSLIVGNAGKFNDLTASSGSITVTGPGGTDIGTNATASDNAILLTGATFTGTGALIVGRSGDSNMFSVQNGSVATTGQARIGLNNGADDNSAIVSGAGSQWTANGTVIVGNVGDTNSLAVLNGGAMTVSGLSKNLWIGKETGSDDNVVTVDGVGSVLNVTDVGSEVVISATNGTGNKLVLSNSGSANVNSIQTGPGGTLQIGDTGAAGFLKSTATINGNSGGGAFGGGTVRFDHNDTNYVFANSMSGPLSVSVATKSSKTTFTGSSSYTGMTEVLGHLALGPAASIAFSGTIRLTNGGTFAVNAVTGGYQLASGQVLTGEGTVVGPATGVVGSIVEPAGDATTGLMTFTGGFTLLGELKVDVDGADIDLLDGSSNGLTLGGSSSVTFNEISAPSGNLIFAKYASLAGSFGTVNALPSGYSIDYNYLGGNQIALVAGAVPEIDPASATSVMALVAGALGMLERRRRRS